MPFLDLKNVSKRYGGVVALDGVNFACDRGSIHAVLGENGAGKSTLIKIIAGVVQPDDGTLELDGRAVRFDGPQAANREGIVCIFQELSLMPDLSVADNICIADPPIRRGMIDRRAQRRRAEALLAEIGCSDVHPLELVRNLPLSRRQMVEIAKALGQQPKLLMLDEATSALTSADVEKVYKILDGLKEKGLAILYISHRMHEIDAVADTCSVFRNGRHIETFAKGSRDEKAIVQMMIGREITQVFPKKPVPRRDAPVALSVDKLSWTDQLAEISLTVREGEILGLGGLDGQGQRELLLAMFGVLRDVDGAAKVNDRPSRIGSPARAKSARNRMALIPEDRKTEGLMLKMSIADNLSLAALGGLSSGAVINKQRERDAVQKMVEKLRIKIGAAEDAVGTLSGGNQQKVVIGKWLMTEPKIILLNDPTRGIDVGTKQELYQLLRDLADAGAAIVFYSTDYDELIGCCDRVLILYGGKVVRVLEGDAINETNIVASSLNLAPGAEHHAT
jgi:ribose transport system ATP-binding protein